MKTELIKSGMSVLTKPLSPCPFPIDPQYQRRHSFGVVVKPDTNYEFTWWVFHTEDNSLAPYLFYELEENPTPPVAVYFSLE